MGPLWGALALIGVCAWAQSVGTLADGKRALAAKQFVQAKAIFAAYEHAHPGDVEAEEGLADAELGLGEYESAEIAYRRVVAAQPEMWLAHKNLVIVEAKLGRWEEFDRERALLRAARERGAPGISARESDVIDSFTVHGQHWIVREYFEPVGRSLTRYNFERFGPDGRVREYVSLESAAAAKDALAAGDVLHSGEQAKQQTAKDFVLDWYNGTAHGTIARYPPHDPHGEPRYEEVRADMRRWAQTAR